MSTTELLSCPFCGGEAGHHRREDDHGDADAYSFVMCEDCGACCSNLDTRPEADCVAAWNRRASQSQQPAEPAEGSPAARFFRIMAELEKRFPNPEPLSSRPPELHYFTALDAAVAAAAVQPPVVPLTADEIVSVARRAGFRIVTFAETDTLMRIARAIEAKVRGIGSVPPSDNPDSNADSVNQERRSGGGVRTEPGDAS